MKTLEEFDEIYKERLTDQEFDDLIDEMIDQEMKKEQLVYRSNIKNPNNRVMINIINNILPVVRLYTNENEEDSNTYELLFYDPIKQIWTMSDLILKNIIIKINSTINMNELNNIKITLKSNKHIKSMNISNNNSINIVDHKFDTFINFSNGRYNIIDDELIPYKPSMISTNILPYEYTDELNEEYKQKFDDYFEGLANGNKRRVILLKQIYLAMLIGSSPKEGINLYGPAGSGKSTYINTGVMLGGGHKNTLFANYSQIGKDDFLTQIKNRTIIAGMDNEDGVKLNKILNTLKSLLSHESFSYSVKYESARTNVFNGVFIQAFNVAPDFRSQGSAQPIIDRMIITKIDNRFRNSQNENKHLSEFFSNNQTLSQLAKYILNEVEAFDKFIEPDKELSEELIEGDDSVKQFFDELRHRGILYSKSIPINQLYFAYLSFCEEQQEHYPKNKNNFINTIGQYLEKYHFVYAKNDKNQPMKKVPSYFESRQLLNLLMSDYLNNNINYPRQMQYFERNDIEYNNTFNDMSLEDQCYYMMDRFQNLKQNGDILGDIDDCKRFYESIFKYDNPNESQAIISKFKISQASKK